MIERVAVVVPAADEQEHVGACLAAIRRTRRALSRTVGHRVATDVVVVLDGCRDATAEIVARYADVTSLVTASRCAGVARQAGADLAITRAAVAGTPAERLWLATTDADSAVPVEWLAHGVSCADGGAEVLLGTVRPDRELDDRFRAAWYGRHRLEDGHPHVHGANLGIRADTLLRLDGWAPIATAEDADLVDRAGRAGARIQRTGAAPVLTSARRVGRAPAGFSSYLRHLAGQQPTFGCDRVVTWQPAC